jgi:hypothetical protein
MPGKIRASQYTVEPHNGQKWSPAFMPNSPGRRNILSGPNSTSTVRIMLIPLSLRDFCRASRLKRERYTSARLRAPEQKFWQMHELLRQNFANQNLQ